MATSAYVYLGNVRRGDGTVGFQFKSSEDNLIYFVPRGATVLLNSADLDRLSNRYILADDTGTPPDANVVLRSMEFLDEGSIPNGQVLTKTSRGFEFEAGGAGGGSGGYVTEPDEQPPDAGTVPDNTLWTQVQ